jgi:hypothetical protein
MAIPPAAGGEHVSADAVHRLAEHLKAIERTACVAEKKSIASADEELCRQCANFPDGPQRWLLDVLGVDDSDGFATHFSQMVSARAARERTVNVCSRSGAS